MPPGNAVRIRRNADQTRTALAGSHEWLPYSKMGKYLRNFRSRGRGGIHASRERGTNSPGRRSNPPRSRREP